MRAGSLFTGIGGFDLGMENIGIYTSFQVEIDSVCRRVLDHHWPDMQRFEDVANVGKRNLPEVDVLTGGFPCQDLSVAGSRTGLAGERSGLWWQFNRIIDETRPKWVVIENVPGLLSSNKGRDMGTLLWSLGKLGYWWSYRVLDAQYFGVPQRRRRVFIVGHSGDRTAPAKVLLEPESCSRDITPIRKTKTKYTSSFEKSSGVCDDADRCRDLETVSKTLRGGERGTDDPDRATFIPVISHTVTTHQAKGGDPTTDNYVAQSFAGVRRLTPLECARLQGFPDDWLDLDPILSDTAKYRMLGNAVAVPVVEWVAGRIAAFESGSLGY